MIDKLRLMKERRCHEMAYSTGALVTRFLDGLPEEPRLALWLFHVEDLRFSEVADILTSSEWRLHEVMRRGLRMMTDTLGQAGLWVPEGRVVGLLRALPRPRAPDRLMERIHRMLLAG